MTGSERSLDRALKGRARAESEMTPLVETARDLEEHFAVEAPTGDRERAMFVEGVAARRHRRRPLLLIPVTAGMAVVFVLGFTAGTALPGDAIYPVRKAMASVGLVASPTEELRSLLRAASSRIGEAESLQSRSPLRARNLAFEAIALLERAARVTADIPRTQRLAAETEIVSLGDRAADVISFVANPDTDDSSGPGSGDDSDDNSGPGSGDDSDDDSSGPGSDDDGDDGDDDNSGPGSDDDDGDDNSGSGSDDDNSGPGSDDSDDLEDLDERDD